ncbi:MAG: hypothetical protein A2Z99_09390 [Treponema sp. GWB1_62_6]|nr:MAG: hypothetical protein A2Y36_07000 [Treponema sp. GWA1_62_8]OHE66208.1 MAG: hypothetical protein A2Z99_09390 [Treponema sp. GWB1_62_6]OHE67434.1 MAG: hypothetical protein A2001_07475 [Treponema sp. GWC1_61_84]OHE76772.1 MAG: hypothetical protein A2413_00130 [Treponema sp. RIFOXYC1_FULL_61_9]HCM28374.1 hypothetical protein [Treponema sp.]
MNKRTIAAAIIAIASVASLAAQQLTRFAVVDLGRVYTAFYRDSKVVRDFEERSARVQAEIDRMTAEIQTLQKTKLDAQSAADQSRVLKADAEIYAKTEFLKDYYRVKTAELEDQKKKLSQSGGFLQQIYDEIKAVAESDGYSMVMNLKESDAVIWYSPTVDITDKLIQNLMTKAGR